MKAKVQWVDGMRMVATSGSGHTVVMDSKDADQPARAASPMEQVLMALGGCSTVDVVEILRKKRQPFTAVEVSLDADRRTEPPRMFTAVRMEFTVRGVGVSTAAVKKAVELSMEKYCSVGGMLRAAGVDITWDIRTEPAEAAYDSAGGRRAMAPGTLDLPQAAPHPEADLPFPDRPGPHTQARGSKGA